jgi:hypothetical protein
MACCSFAACEQTLLLSLPDVGLIPRVMGDSLVEVNESNTLSRLKRKRIPDASSFLMSLVGCLMSP